MENPKPYFLPKDFLDKGYGVNLNKPIKKILHSDLKRSDDKSMYRSHCPECDGGVLLVHRDQKTFKLIPYDNCIKCGQQFEYLDFNNFDEVKGV